MTAGRAHLEAVLARALLECIERSAFQGRAGASDIEDVHVNGRLNLLAIARHLLDVERREDALADAPGKRGQLWR